MKAIVEARRFFNTGLGESSSDFTDYQLANIGDKETVEIDIRYEDYVLATTNDTDNASLISIVVFPNSDLTNGVIPENTLLWTSSPNGFETFRVGDEITLTNSSSGITYVRIIEEIINSQLLRTTITFALPQNTKTGVDSIVYVSTLIEAIEFLHGVIENSSPANYIDLTTGDTRRAQVEGLSNTLLTPTPMIQLGNKSGQYGSISVKGNGIGDGPTGVSVSQAFTITHTYLVAPLFKAEQEEDDTNGVAPIYLRNANSLKYVFRIEASKDLNNPNDIKTVISGEVLGNVGYENESYNTGLTNYSIANVVYRKLDATVISQLELTTNEQTIEYDILNTIDNPFSIGNTRVIPSHWFKPLPESEYREPEFPTEPNEAKNRLFKVNFLFDRAETTSNDPAVAVAGENIGGIDQIIKESESKYISSSKIHVKTTIRMSDDAVARIEGLTDRNYKLIVSTKNHALTKAKGDAVSLLVDKNTYFTDTTDPSMITLTNGFHNHPMVIGDTPKESLLLRQSDDFVCGTIFVLDRNDITDFTRQGVEISFLSVEAQLIARKNSTTSFVLDEYSVSLGGIDIIDDATYGTVPFMDIEEDRGFASPVDDFRKNIVLKRREDLETPATGLFYFSLSLPAIFRDDPWEALPDASNDFLDSGADANHHLGKNHNWLHYFDGTDWTLYYTFQIVATKDGFPITYNSPESPLFVEDYDDGNEWNAEITKAFRTKGGGDEIIGGGIMTSENTLIQSEATYINPDTPTLPDLVFVQIINIFERTNFKGAFYISTKYPVNIATNAWIGLLGALTATKTNPSGTTFRVESEINYLNFTADTEVRSRFRIYDLRDESGIPDGKTTEQGVLKKDEIGFVKDIE